MDPMLGGVFFAMMMVMFMTLCRCSLCGCYCWSYSSAVVDTSFPCSVLRWNMSTQHPQNIPSLAPSIHVFLLEAAKLLVKLKQFANPQTQPFATQVGLIACQTPLVEILSVGSNRFKTPEGVPPSLARYDPRCFTVA